jgi:hypothetical protein
MIDLIDFGKTMKEILKRFANYSIKIETLN